MASNPRRIAQSSLSACKELCRSSLPRLSKLYRPFSQTTRAHDTRRRHPSAYILRTHKLPLNFQSPDNATVAALKNSEQSPLEVLRQSIQLGTANVATISHSLKLYQDSLSKLSPEESCEKTRADQAGRLALRWLLVVAPQESAAHPVHVKESLTHNGFLYTMCDLLVKAGDEEMLWTWLSSQSSEFDDPSINTPDLVKRWRSFVLRNLVACKLEMALEAKRPSADDAIRTYFKAATMKKEIEHPENFVRTMSLHPANQALLARLKCGHYPATDAGLWDNFRALSLAYTRGSKDRYLFDGTPPPLQQHNLTAALLDIVHPTRPSPDLALEAVRASIGDTDVPAKVVESWRSLRFFDMLARKTADLLKRQARVVEAEEAEGIARRFRELMLQLFDDDGSPRAMRRLQQAERPAHFRRYSL